MVHPPCFVTVWRRWLRTEVGWLSSSSRKSFISPFLSCFSSCNLVYSNEEEGGKVWGEFVPIFLGVHHFYSHSIDKIQRSLSAREAGKCSLRCGPVALTLQTLEGWTLDFGWGPESWAGMESRLWLRTQQQSAWIFSPSAPFPAHTFSLCLSKINKYFKNLFKN